MFGGIYTDEDETPGSAHHFDSLFDTPLTGGSFSCAIAMRPSEARRALDRFRSGVLYDVQADFEASVRFPLTASAWETLALDSPGIVVALQDFDEWLAFKNEHLKDVHLAMISCANVRNVIIRVARGGYGFTIGLGTVWFTQFVGPEPPMVEAISLRPTPDEYMVEFCTGRRP